MLGVTVRVGVCKLCREQSVGFGGVSPMFLGSGEISLCLRNARAPTGAAAISLKPLLHITSQHRSLCGPRSSGARGGNPHQFIRFSPGTQAGAHFRCCGAWFLVWSSICLELLISTNGITHIAFSGLSGNHLLAGFLAWEEVLRALLGLLGEWGRNWVKERGLLLARHQSRPPPLPD